MRVKKKKSRKSAAATTSIAGAMPVHRLLDLFLTEASVSRPGIRKGPPPAHLSFNLNVAVKKPEKDGEPLIVKITINVDARYDDDDKPPALRLMASFVVVYSVPPGVSALTSDELFAVFGQQQGVYHVWPYWREFVQSATSRMGLPPLKMPLIVPSQLPFAEAD